jgi:hypothetical protein
VSSAARKEKASRPARSGKAAHEFNPLLLETDHLLECPTTLHRDFTMQDYKPRRDPRERLHVGTLLRYLLRQERLIDDVWPVVDRLRKHIGPDQTVWSAKWTPAGFHSFELYFYNWKTLPHRDRRTLSSLQSALRPWLNQISPVHEGRNYQICSFDIDASFRTMRQVQSAHLYIPSEEEFPNGDFLSYGVHKDGLRLENHYSTFLAKGEFSKARQRLRLSIHSGHERNRAVLLPKQLTRCFRISYATKALCDGLYFNRVTIDQAAWFAGKYLPIHVARMLKATSGQFEHLYFDVGFDFVAPDARGGAVALRKFAIFGLI